MTDAFKVSLNTTAADLSFKVGRDKVLEMTRRLGVVGVKRTCSMALGDTGITVLQHTAAYATFANGGKLSRPYVVLELTNSKGEVVYSRGRSVDIEIEADAEEFEIDGDEFGTVVSARFRVDPAALIVRVEE